VGTRASNELGLYDMSGNVWEWVWDWWWDWGLGTYPSVAETDPVGASSGSHRVIRGGGWNSSGWDLRPVFSLNVHPPSRSPLISRAGLLGFRLVRPASPSF